jgi:hypothetical protein
MVLVYEERRQQPDSQRDIKRPPVRGGVGPSGSASPFFMRSRLQNGDNTVQLIFAGVFDLRPIDVFERVSLMKVRAIVQVVALHALVTGFL